jgi:hypothetical protein
MNASYLRRELAGKPVPVGACYEDEEKGNPIALGGTQLPSRLGCAGQD